MRFARIIGLIILLGLSAGSALAADNTQFNYQGRVLVNNAPFTGAGFIKLAIVNTTGTISLWSNDNTSVNGSQPTAGVAVTVVNGVFDIMVGNTTLGMQPIKSIMFNGRTDMLLRVWFNDGTHGFQLLAPDRPIPGAGTTLGLRKITETTNLYVNATTGNDANSGLATTQAKKTVQSAVDMLPPQIAKDTIIHIANGTYREQVNLSGIDVAAGGQTNLVLEGDTSWTTASPGNPQVRITGTDNDVTRVRARCIFVQNCTGIYIRGMLLDYATAQNLCIDSCSFTTVNSVVCSNSGASGYYMQGSVVGVIQNVRCTNNSVGAIVTRNSEGQFAGTCTFSNNTAYGVEVSGNSSAAFRADLGYTGTIQSNTQYGLILSGNSYTFFHTLNTFSGNGIAPTNVSSGSGLY